MATKAKTQTDTPKAAAIYARISLDRNGDGLGVERQVTLCRKLARERGWHVVDVYEDNDRSAHSGKARPAYERLLADIEAGVRDAVLVVDIDRLTRRPAELERFMELADTHNVALANVAGDIDLSSSDGRFRARILGAVARMEGEKKGERVAREAEQAAQRGVPRGSHRPFGYEDDKVTIREDEAALIRDAAQRVLDGATIPAIAREWNAKKIATPQDAPHGWSAATLAGILRNPRITGLRTYKGEVVADGVWEGIVDRDVFEKLQAKIRRGSRPGRAPKALLTAIARCGRCGAPLWTSGRKGRGRRIRRYACVKRPGAPGCGATTIVAEPLDRLITDAVMRRLSTRAIARAMRGKPKSHRVDIDLAQLERDLEGLASDFGSGDISRREWLAARKPLEERFAAARRAVDAANGTTALAPLRNTKDIRATWDNLDVERQRAILDTLVDRITINPAPKPGRFDADRIDVVWRA